jgi:hypothetical protein
VALILWYNLDDCLYLRFLQLHLCMPYRLSRWLQFLILN